MGIVQDPLCARCGEADETAYHLVGYCEGWVGPRLEVFGQGEQTEEEVSGVPWNNILFST